MRISLPLAGAFGLVSDPYEQDVAPNAFSRVKNARFGDKGAKAFGGHTQVFAGSITPTWVKWFPTRTNPRWVYANNNQVWVYEGLVHTEITRASGDYNASQRWQGGVFHGICILNNGFDPPQRWEPIDNTSALEDLTAWPINYRCRFIKPFGNFLMAGGIHDGTTDYPYRMLWSHPAAPGSVPANWNFGDPTSDSRFIDLQKADKVVDGLDMGDLFIVYREGSTWAMAQSDVRNKFRNFEISNSSGILAMDCMISIPRKGHVVATQEDLIIHQGSSQSFQSLLDNRARRIFDTINREFAYNSFLVQNFPEKEVWFCFPEVGHEYASRALVWNSVNGQVGHRDLPEVPFADAGPVMLEEAGPEPPVVPGAGGMQPGGMQPGGMQPGGMEP